MARIRDEASAVYDRFQKFAKDDPGGARVLLALMKRLVAQSAQQGHGPVGAVAGVKKPRKVMKKAAGAAGAAGAANHGNAATPNRQTTIHEAEPEPEAVGALS